MVPECRGWVYDAHPSKEAPWGGYYTVTPAHLKLKAVRRAIKKARNTSKFVYVELNTRCGKLDAAELLGNAIAVAQYRIHIVLTDDAIQFTSRRKDKCAFVHIFDRVYRTNGIEHWLTQVNHPWRNGQVARMNRTLKKANVMRLHYESHQKLQAHLQNFVNACNFAKSPNTLKGSTPYEFVINCWQ